MNFKELDLFVFAGQSNMMGASATCPTQTEFTDLAFEYKYMPKLRTNKVGEFVKAQNPCGEFFYTDLHLAYGDKIDQLDYKSCLTNYTKNTYFCPAMSNGKMPFSEQSESQTYPSASIPPYFATEYAKFNHACVYSHIAKGNTRITHFFTKQMASEYNALINEYNQKNNTVYQNIDQVFGAGKAFDDKYNAMVEDFAILYPSTKINNKCFLFLQGESDGDNSYIEYKLKLGILWKHLKSLGITHFFIFRVGFWGNENIINVIKAQEDFCLENENCYIITRAPSLISHPLATTENWWINTPCEEYQDCRDTFVNNNNHFNEKAMQLFASRSAINVHRILYLGEQPILEKENVKLLKP